MDWEAEGLLEGLEDEAARDARRELLDHLRDEGCSVDELKQAVKEDRLVLLPVERFLAGDAEYTQRDLAEQSGFELEQLSAFRQSLGLAVPEPDARVFTEEDLATAKDAAKLAEVGFPFEETLDVTRVLGPACRATPRRCGCCSRRRSSSPATMRPIWRSGSRRPQES